MAFALCLSWVSPVPGNPAESHFIKAVYLRNALNFAYYPKDTFPTYKSPFLIGIAGDAPGMKESLDLAFGQLGHKIQNRKVEIQVFPDPGSMTGNPSQSPQCHALFLPESETAKIKEWIQAADGKRVLFCSEDQGCLQQGGDVALSPNPSFPNRYLYHIHVGRLKGKDIRFHTNFLRTSSSVKVIKN